MNKYRYIRRGIAVLVGIASLLAFYRQFYPVKIFDIQLMPAIQKVLVDFSLVSAVLVTLILLFTLLFGRIYCSTLCPLGLFQELLMLLFRRRPKLQAGHMPKYFVAAAVWGALLGGTAFFIRYLDPYTIFGSAASFAYFGLAVAVLLALLVWFKGRFFCTNVCPVGAVLGLIAKHSIYQLYIQEDKCVACGLCAKKCPAGCIDFKNKTVNNETCIRCFECLGGCHHNGLTFGRRPKKDVAFNLQRRQFLIGSAALVVAAVAFKGGVRLVQSAVQKAKNIILPAGGGDVDRFANKCLNCNLCVQNCPMKILKKANANYPAVHIDYSESFCDYDCNRCSQVCPSGAIKRLTLDSKRRTKIAQAVVDDTICVKCGMCVAECPRGAIRKEDGYFPQVNADECIGCGACHCVCPVGAISMSAVEKQKEL